MRVSVVICTYNRAAFLDKLLGSLVRQEFTGEHEVIVVDNNSIDNTKEVVTRWRPLAHPRCPIHYIVATQQGLSHARNTGAIAAGGDVVAFIDDDAVAEQRWLQHIIDDMTDQAISCVGGKVIPDWSEPPPPWLTPLLWPAIGGSIHGETRRIMSGKLYPMGGNMAVRQSWYQLVGGFNPQLGRVGRNLVSVEEIEFADRIRRQGGLMLYDPDMIIYHYVPPERMSTAYLARRYYWDGRSMARWERIRGRRYRQWIVGLIRLLVAVPRDLSRLAFYSILGRQYSAFASFCGLERTRGYLDELRHSRST
jgi:glucosyl-dolichyl phosphate glucuronosyltransferase